MAGLDSQMGAWLQDVKELVPNEQKRTEMTKAGAKTLADSLGTITRANHYSNKKDEKYGHMADHVTFNGNDIDGEKDGSSVVGWDNPYHAMNARRLNDGTKHIRADHFVDAGVAASEDDVFNAMRKAYEEG